MQEIKKVWLKEFLFLLLVLKITKYPDSASHPHTIAPVIFITAKYIKWADVIFDKTIGVVIATIKAHTVPKVVAITKVPTISKIKNL